MRIDWPWLRLETLRGAGFISLRAGPGRWRVLGFKDLRRYPMLFSERNGLTKCWRLGRWLITWRGKKSGFHW